MNPELLLGPYGLVVGLIFVVIYQQRELTELRRDATKALQAYRDRDEAKRKLEDAEEADRRRGRVAS